MQLIKTLHDDDFGKSSPVSSGAGKSDQPDWNMRIQYTPEPETKALVLRQVVDEQISGDSLEQYLDPSKYRCVCSLLERYYQDTSLIICSLVNAYIVEGQRLICKDIILTMHRVLYYKDADRAQAMPHADLPLLEDLILLDLSGAFLLEASIRIDDRTKPVQVQKATEELKWFKNEMRGSVDLRTPERLALDTRVRDS